MSMLSKLKPLVKPRKVIGRGGDRGGTSGRGHKGQKARSGPHIGVQFEGGQMALTRRLPKFGFNNARFSRNYEIINLGEINKRFDAGTTINKELLVQLGIIKSKVNSKNILLKILANGSLDKDFIIHANAFSASALKKISDKGGQAHIIE